VKRRAVIAAVVVALLTTAVLAELVLGSVPETDPLGKRVLYLPSKTMLQMMSLGNDGLVADLLYLWAIQYYSQFDFREKFLYLNTVFNLITDLDPRYRDPYRIGAMIMSLQKHGDRAAHRAAIVALYDKGIAAMPDDWEIAEIAAWDAHLVLQDKELAVRWMGEAASRPDAPNTIKRIYARWRDDIHGWTVEDSIAYWEEVVAGAETKVARNLATSHLYDSYVTLHRRQLDPVLRSFFERFGRCAESWQDVVDGGLIKSEPVDALGNPYGVDPETCTLVAHKKIRWD
jgi:hypothetical protein